MLMQSFALEFVQSDRADIMSCKGSEIAKKSLPHHWKVDDQAQAVVAELMQVRRLVQSVDPCGTTCSYCAAAHLGKVKTAIAARKPITFVLPAFPGKSPNLSKVLGPLPDMAEQQALQFLNGLCLRIYDLYRPGAHIVLCSDGRVFSDVVGISESDVTNYQNELKKMIETLGLETISTFNLDELCDGVNFDQVRQVMLSEYGQSYETLRAKVSRGGKGSVIRDDQDIHRLFCGITRFLLEDSSHPGQTLSRTALQKDSRMRAYEVIRRSNAWSELIAKRFPAAVRLSIHPQACGSSKLGIQLLGDSGWATPWHGVAVERGGKFELMKRWEAEKLGLTLVTDATGRASHFKSGDFTEKGAKNEL